MRDPIRVFAELESLIGDDRANASVESIESEMRFDDVAATMAEPAGPLKRIVPGRPQSGLPDDDA